MLALAFQSCCKITDRSGSSCQMFSIDALISDRRTNPEAEAMKFCMVSTGQRSAKLSALACITALLMMFTQLVA